MKHRLSITVDEDTIVKVRELLRKKEFRNKSHAFEYSLLKVFEEVKE